MKKRGQHLRLRNRRALIWALQATVAGVLLWLLFRNPELRAGVGNVAREGDWRWILGGLGCAGAGIVANIFRWRGLLAIQRIRVRPGRLGAIFLVGSFFNLFFPGVVGGEAVNALYLMREHPGKRLPIVLSIAADHLSGLVALAVAAGAFAAPRAGEFLSAPQTASAYIFMWIAIAAGVAFVATTFVLVRETICERMPPHFPARERLTRMADSYRLFARHWGRSLAACGMSFAVLFAYFGSFYCAGKAFGVAVTLLDVFSVMPVVDVLAMIPVSISGLGVREIAMKELLGVLCGVPGEQAVIMSLTGFAFTVFWGVVGGLAFPFVKMSRAQAPLAGEERTSMPMR